MHEVKKEDTPLRSVDGYLSGKAQTYWPGSLVYSESEGTLQKWTLERPGMEALGIGADFGRAHQGLMSLIALEKGKYPPIVLTCALCKKEFKVSSATRIAVEKKKARMPDRCGPCAAEVNEARRIENEVKELSKLASAKKQREAPLAHECKYPELPCAICEAVLKNPDFNERKGGS